MKYETGTTYRVTLNVVRETPCDYTTDTPETLLRYWHEVIATQPDYESDKESLIVVMMDSHLRPIAWHRVALGSLTEVTAHPREILRPVITAGSYGFALMHNHPSGDPSPSGADEKITRRLVEGSELLGLRFFDHLIVGDDFAGRRPYFSFKETGMMR